jgi:undecaprenyl diphosphate synthase
VRQIIRAGIPAEQVTEELLNQYMYTGGLPDPDLIIRTSGELRVSNFLIWQGAYSEYYVTPTYWPDFSKDELRKAIDEYNRRTRRFGMTDEQLNPA